MHLDSYTVREIQQGYHQEPQTKAWRCILCGQRYEADEVYSFDGRLFTAARAVCMHMEREHPDHTEVLIRTDSRYNTLTENQMQLLALFSEGLSDKEIAGRLDVSASTVRHQKFMFREKAKQAKLYLAIFESVFDRADTKESIVPIHEHARMVDQRYVVTQEERDGILSAAFSSLEPLKLKRFPPKEKKKLVILTKIATCFEPDRRYTEKEVNAVLSEIFDDYVTIRRYLIEYGFMQRTRNGSEYRLT